MDITTTYLGLKLASPLIVGSSGLTGSVDKITAFARHGAGAVVLKSIFEEEILFEYEDIIKEAQAEGVNLDQFDYYDYHLKGKRIDKYIELIRSAKKAVDIPVIASINCIFSHEWTAFADRIQEAGADALELNMFFLPSDFERSAREQEEAYFRVIDKVLAAVSIPVALKISYYFSNLGPMIQRLSRTGVAGLVLFNRFFSPDIDIDALKVVSEGVNALRSPERSMLVITHYQRLLDYIVPDKVHVLSKGRIVKTGGKELALELEKSGYAEYGADEAA
jgi:dihydroorotate dehydrogenase (fumarate)